ncbi:MAG: hypothetical protein HYY41_04735 [Chloroflexi bacterium]|nr:hypothetical protein [Chloroflexota bacterium]MBI2980117.1 hypothetical protein [Chloroflexota bacterium]
MLELKGPSTIFVAIIAAVALLLLGDYLGYKIGRRKFALIFGVVALITIVVFAIYAATVGLT